MRFTSSLHHAVNCSQSSEPKDKNSRAGIIAWSRGHRLISPLRKTEFIASWDLAIESEGKEYITDPLFPSSFLPAVFSFLFDPAPSTP